MNGVKSNLGQKQPHSVSDFLLELIVLLTCYFFKKHWKKGLEIILIIHQRFYKWELDNRS